MDGTLVFQRVAFTVPTTYGVLSGLAIDTTDSLWVAMYSFILLFYLLFCCFDFYHFIALFFTTEL